MPVIGFILILNKINFLIVHFFGQLETSVASKQPGGFSQNGKRMITSYQG